MNSGSQKDRVNESENASCPSGVIAATPASDARDFGVSSSSTNQDRTQTTVRELMAEWPMARFSFALSRETVMYLSALLVATVVTLVLSVVLFVQARSVYFMSFSTSAGQENHGGVAADAGDRPFADGKTGEALLPWAEQVQIIPSANIDASHAALADISTGEIIASRKADETIYPASMTKIMTLIVVAENLPNDACLKDIITISDEVYEEMKRQGASGIGMVAGEKISVESLIYALMLKSDGIAACELARYVAGSEEDFVELMNQKAEKMGLTGTHFMNPTGLYHANHTSTARDIASIMAYAMNMSLCRRVLLTKSYNAPFTTTDGQNKSYYLYHNLTVTLFEKYQPNQPTTVTVLAGKTGFTDESRYCLVTYAETTDGHGYVCVTAESESYATCIEDYITIYNTYAKP